MGALVSCITALAMTTGSAQADHAAWIDVAETGTGYTLTAFVSSKGAFEGRAMLSLDRVGRAGTATARQGSSVSLRPGETVTVATSSLSFEAGDRLDATLVMMDAQGKEEARCVVNLGG
jgi:hypothetical protein